jgi:hypothetical protein
MKKINIISSTLFFFLFIYLQKCNSHNIKRDEDEPTRFVIVAYDEDKGIRRRYRVTFNYSTYLFNENKRLSNIIDVQNALICNEDDIDNNEEEIKTLLLWHPGNSFSENIYFLNAFPIWYNEHKKKNEIFCLKTESVGWEKNAMELICDDKNSTIPCPDLISLGTTQLQLYILTP